MQITVILALMIALGVGEFINESPEDELLVRMDYFDGFNALALLLGIIVLAGSLMRLASRYLVKRLESTNPPSRANLRLPGRVDFLLRTGILVMFAAVLTAGGWGRLVIWKWQLHRFVLLDEICLMLPFVVMMVLHWYNFYPVNRFVREYVVAGQLIDGLSARPVWSRRQYLSFQIRSNLLIILAPVLLILGFRDVVVLVKGRFFAEVSHANLIVELVTTGGALTVFLFAPLLLRRVWLTRSLPAGPLRFRLEEFCVKMRLKYRDILLWDTYGAVANAAVMGLLHPVRYVLLSDALIENMPDEQIEAVFGHEAGHVRKHHILFLGLFIFSSLFIVALLSELVALWLNGASTAPQNQVGLAEQLQYGWFGLLVLTWGFLFGWVSRRFERQADVHAAQVLNEKYISANQGESTDEINENTDSQQKNRLGITGARIVGSALLRIALLNGISPEARSWRHSSIASRVLFLRELADKKNALKKFERVVTLTKIMILLALIVGLSGFLLLPSIT